VNYTVNLFINNNLSQNRSPPVIIMRLPVALINPFQISLLLSLIKK